MLSISVGYIKIYFKDNFMKDVCVFMHGSGGISKANLWYVKFLVNSGMTVFVPNNEIICPKCTGYSSSFEKLLIDNKMKNLYKKIIRLRTKQITQTIDLIYSLNYKGKISLYGISEGSIIVARYTNDKRNGLINKKVIMAYSPEYNYYAETNKPLRGKKNIIKINIVGKKDEYFGNIKNSIAGKYAKYINRPIEGNMLETCIQSGHKCKVYILEDCTHDLTKNKSLLRSILKTVIHSQM